MREQIRLGRGVERWVGLAAHVDVCALVRGMTCIIADASIVTASSDARATGRKLRPACRRETFTLIN